MSFLKNKHGVEMSLSVIVIAVILLIVLAVLMFIFFKSSNTFKDGVSTCSGECKLKASGCGDDKVAIPMKCSVGGDSTSNTGNVCCKSLG